jgi:hypothetical protein
MTSAISRNPQKTRPFHLTLRHSGLTRREAELVATKAAPGSPLNLSSARRAEERLRGFGRIVVAKESWPRRRKADGGHEQSPSI